MKIAIIVPRYGPDVAGGAETLARTFAEKATRLEWTVEVWTTCARSHYTWKNVYPSGDKEHEGISVRRFPIAPWNKEHHTQLDRRLARQGRLPVTEQYDWIESGAHSPALYKHVAQHADRFDAVIALPCATPLIHYAAWSAPQRIVIWPCLHNEPYAHMEPSRLLLESVWGAMFLSPEERDLATRCLHVRFRHEAIVRGGVIPLRPCDHPRRTRPPCIDLLYVGRLEPGKGLARLYDYVRRYADAGGRARLIVMGKGPLKPPRHRAFKYLGFIPEIEKARAYASATALCQPSLNESFSITLMESWLATRPVLVHGQCAVTRGHVQRSKGGLWFQSYQEFAGTLEWLQTNPDLANRMGQNGQRYVQSNYSWEIVLARFERIVTHWKKADA